MSISLSCSVAKLHFPSDRISLVVRAVSLSALVIIISDSKWRVRGKICTAASHLTPICDRRLTRPPHLLLLPALLFLHFTFHPPCDFTLALASHHFLSFPPNCSRHCTRTRAAASRSDRVCSPLRLRDTRLPHTCRGEAGADETRCSV